jgi:hypothetical protein
MAVVLDHVGFQCADLAASAAFYDVALEPLGGQRIMDFGVAIGYGVPDRPDFWISAQETGDGFRESHISFTAPSRAHAHQLRGPSRRREDRRLAALGVSRRDRRQGRRERILRVEVPARQRGWDTQQAGG